MGDIDYPEGISFCEERSHDEDPSWEGSHRAGIRAQGAFPRGLLQGCSEEGGVRSGGRLTGGLSF